MSAVVASHDAASGNRTDLVSFSFTVHGERWPPDDGRSLKYLCMYTVCEDIEWFQKFSLGFCMSAGSEMTFGVDGHIQRISNAEYF